MDKKVVKENAAMTEPYDANSLTKRESSGCLVAATHLSDQKSVVEFMESTIGDSEHTAQINRMIVQLFNAIFDTLDHEDAFPWDSVQLFVR